MMDCVVIRNKSFCKIIRFIQQGAPRGHASMVQQLWQNKNRCLKHLASCIESREKTPYEGSKVGKSASFQASIDDINDKSLYKLFDRAILTLTNLSSFFFSISFVLVNPTVKHLVKRPLLTFENVNHFSLPKMFDIFERKNIYIF